MLLLLWILTHVLWTKSMGLECGYPGSPAFGRPNPVKETYRPGDAVSFTCAHGYALQGPLQRVCAMDGTWSGSMPLCDRSLSSVEHVASSRQTLSLYPASKAIDGDPRTCAYTDKSRPRWVRFDMRTARRVRAVAITVPRGTYSQDPAQLTIYAIQVRDNTTASYHKCASFNGRFATATLQLSCSGGEAEGRYIHVEDNRHKVDYFSLCEIQVFVNKDSYECGEAERPANAYSVRTQSGAVEYRCLYGFRLEGPTTRECMQNGQWSNPQPICREIVCPGLGAIAHGRLVYSGRRGDVSVLGSTVNVSCDYGYEHYGEPMVCGQDGRWSNGNISCKAVECGLPVPRHESEQYELINGTSYGSATLWRCGELEQTILCREDGTWTQPDNECQPQVGVANLGLVDEQSEIPTGIVIGMTIVVFLLVVAVILILLLKRKKVVRQNSADSIPSKETTPPSAQPYENDAFYATIPGDNRSSSKSPSLLSTVLFPRRHQSPSANNDSGHSSASCIYEEIGGTKKPTPPPASEEVSSPPPRREAVYACVDLEEKRRSRLAKARAPPTTVAGGGEELNPNRLMDEVDLEPIKLRELPPIPDDNGSGVTYASLAFPLDPPSECRRNHAPGDTVMKDNELYLSSTTIKL